jgi:hypothetical protein
VLATINFDSQSSFVAYEISNETSDLHLSSEMGTRKRQAVTQMPPKFLFSLGRIAPHPSGKESLAWGLHAIS